MLNSHCLQDPITLTWWSEVSQGDLWGLHLSSHVFGHALIHALVCLPRVLDHQGSIFQKIETCVVPHVQSIADQKKISCLWTYPSHIED